MRFWGISYCCVYPIMLCWPCVSHLLPVVSSWYQWPSPGHSAQLHAVRPLSARTAFESGRPQLPRSQGQQVGVGVLNPGFVLIIRGSYYCNSLDGWAPIYFIYMWLISKRVAKTWPHGRVPTPIAKTLGSQLIRHWSDTFPLDGCFIDIDPKVFAIWVGSSPSNGCQGDMPYCAVYGPAAADLMFVPAEWIITHSPLIRCYNKVPL